MARLNVLCSERPELWEGNEFSSSFIERESFPERRHTVAEVARAHPHVDLSCTLKYKAVTSSRDISLRQHFLLLPS